MAIVNRNTLENMLGLTPKFKILDENGATLYTFDYTTTVQIRRANLVAAQSVDRNSPIIDAVIQQPDEITLEFDLIDTTELTALFLTKEDKLSNLEALFRVETSYGVLLADKKYPRVFLKTFETERDYVDKIHCTMVFAEEKIKSVLAFSAGDKQVGAIASRSQTASIKTTVAS